MEKEYYNNIINALDEKIKICKENFGLIKTQEDVENVPSNYEEYLKNRGRW